MQNFKSVWAAAVDLLQSSINETAMNLWIKTITPLKYESDYAVLKVESDFQRDVIMTRYKSLIVKALEDVVGFEMNIKLRTTLFLPLRKKPLRLRKTRAANILFQTLLLPSPTNTRLLPAKRLQIILPAHITLFLYTEIRVSVKLTCCLQ